MHLIYQARPLIPGKWEGVYWIADQSDFTVQFWDRLKQAVKYEH